MEIHNLYSIDLFLQGLFLLLCLSTGLYIVFKDNLEAHKDVNSIKEFSNNLYKLFIKVLNVFSLGNNKENDDKEGGDKFKFTHFGLIPLIIVFAFIIGVLGNGIADKWIDSESRYHFGLKMSWGVGEGIESYKDHIREQSFNSILLGQKVPPNDSNIINQLYYNAKHKIILNDTYYKYVRKNQSMAEYSRVFSLGFFFLLICSLINLILMIFRITLAYINERRSKIQEEKKKKINAVNIPNSIILIFSFISLVLILITLDIDTDIVFSKKTQNFFSYILSPFKWVLIGFVLFFGVLVHFLIFFKNFQSIRFTLFVYAIIYNISLLGYLTSSSMWYESEEKVAKKIFGVYKTMNSDFKDSKLPEFIYARDILDLDKKEKKLKTKKSDN